MATMTGTDAVTLKRVEAHYPREVTLADDHPIQLQLMGERDVDAVLAFARTLPPNDLMYLKVNITEPPVVQNWGRLHQGGTDADRPRDKCRTSAG